MIIFWDAQSSLNPDPFQAERGEYVDIRPLQPQPVNMTPVDISADSSVLARFEPDSSAFEFGEDAIISLKPAQQTNTQIHPSPISIMEINDGNDLFFRKENSHNSHSDEQLNEIMSFLQDKILPLSAVNCLHLRKLVFFGIKRDKRAEGRFLGMIW